MAVTGWPKGVEGWSPLVARGALARVNAHPLRPMAAVAAFAVALAAGGCNKGSEGQATTTTTSAAATTAPPEVPPPFSELRIGLAWEKVSAAYPPAEELASCAPELVGGDVPMPAPKPGDEAKRRSFCARAMDVAGTTEAEGVKVLEAAARTKKAPMLTAMAHFYIAAQVRGSVRAGTIEGGEILGAAQGSETANEAVLRVVGKLYDGSMRFAKEQSSRRPIGACIAADCDGFERERIRKYLAGELSLAEIDREAHKRVASGKCREPYVKNEGDLQRKFVAATGGLAAIGLARATQSHGELDPDAPATFAVYASRSKLDGETARLGVRIANGLAKSEAYWKGAIALDPGETGKPTFGRAIVWIEDQKVARLLVNINDEEKMAALVGELTTLYGKPATSEPSRVRWKLESGRTATLHLGVAMALVVE